MGLETVSLYRRGSVRSDMAECVGGEVILDIIHCRGSVAGTWWIGQACCCL